MTVQRVIRNGKAVVVLQVPDVRALEKARKVAVQIAMLGDKKGDALIDTIDDILGVTDEDPSLSIDNTLVDDDEDSGEPTTADEFNDEIPA
jgi:hypothetical protein